MVSLTQIQHRVNQIGRVHGDVRETQSIVKDYVIVAFTQVGVCSGGGGRKWDGRDE